MAILEDDPLDILRKNKQRQERLLALATSDDDEAYNKALEGSATGRDFRRESFRAKQLKTTEDGLADPNLTPSARNSLTILKDYIESPDFGKLPGRDKSLVNAEGKAIGQGAELARSYWSGFVADAIPGLLDLPLAVAQKLGVHGPIDKLREGLTEGRLTLKEKIDARTPGIEGKILEFVGALSNPVALKGYGALAGASGQVLSGGAKAVGLAKLGEGIATGISSANPLIRAGTNVLTGLPLNVAQQAQLPDDAAIGDRMKQLLFGVSADALGGAVFGGKGHPEGVDVAFKGDPVTLKPNLEVAHTPEITPDKQVILDAMALKAKQTGARKAIEDETKAYDSSSSTQAAAEWQAENMGKKWSKEAKDTKATVVADWQKEHPIEWWREKTGKVAPVAENLTEGSILPTTAQGDTPIAPVAPQEGLAVVPHALEAIPPQKAPLELIQDKATVTALAKGKIDAPTVESLSPESKLSTVDANATLPKELSKASPNYNYGEKRFNLSFDSDVDKAAYITAQTIPSRRDKDFLDFAMKATGMAEDEVRAYGAEVKGRVKAMARDGTPGAMVVEAGTPKAVEVPVIPRASVVSPVVSPDVAVPVTSTIAGEPQAPVVQNSLPPASTPVVQNSTPRAPTMQELNKIEDGLMNKISKLEERWQAENPGKSFRKMVDWKDPEYIATRDQLNSVGTQKSMLPEADKLDSMDALISPNAPTGGTMRVQPQADPTAPTQRSEQRVATLVSKDLPASQLDMRKALSPRKLSDAELATYASSIHERIGTLGEPSAEQQYLKLLEGVIGEQTARKVTSQLKSQANMPPGVFGAGLGFTYGVATTDEKDPHAATRIMMWTLAGAAAGYGAGKIGERIQIGKETTSKINRLFPGQSVLAKDQANVIGIGDKVKDKQPFTAIMRNWYNGAVRRIASFENLVGKMPIEHNLPLSQNPVKLAEHFNRSIARTESWNHYAVVLDGPDGEPLYLGPTFLGEDVKPAQHILAMVDQDKEGLGKVMVALTSLELHSMGHERVPYDEHFATGIIKNAPQIYIDAAREFRKFNLAMLKVMQFSGRLSQTTFDRLSKEEWYAPLYRSVEGGTTRNIRDLKDNRITTKDVFKTRQGGSKQLDVINPVDQTLTLLPYILRNHEYSQWVDNTVKMLRKQPVEVQRLHIKLVKSSDSETVKKIMEEAKTLRESIPLNNAESDRLMAFKDDGTSARGGGGYITHWEEGVLSTYKVSDVIFDTAKSLLPFERDVVNNVVFRAARETTRLATKGIVLHPKFVETQFFLDTFDNALTSKYNFRPGVDSFRGWWSIVSRSPEYLRTMDMGGLGSVQSLPYQTADSATKMFAAEGKNALAVSWNHMKEMHPLEAYKALAMPLAEAGRMGEALRAFDHKASTIEAVFAAREVGFNVSMEGSFTAIRALHQLSMFTRPGFQAVDALVRSAGRDPAAFLAKGIGYIALPTAALWWANKDDKEIQKWRKTQAGKGYLFARIQGAIVRMRKPHIIGQIFGTAVEEMLDKMNGVDPQMEEVMHQTYNDAASNMLPLFGVIPLSLLADKDFSDLGEMRTVTSPSDKGLEKKYQGRDRASLPARIISDVTANILSPAQTDYIIRTVSTTVGMDFAQAITAAHEYYAYGFLPAAHEMPIVRGAFQNPNSQGQEVYKFYKYMEDIEPAALTAKHLSEPGNLVKNPQAYINYYKENVAQINLIDTFTEARKDIGEYRRAIEDMDKMKSIVSQATIESVKKQYLKQMEDRARSANLAAKAMGMK